MSRFLTMRKCITEFLQKHKSVNDCTGEVKYEIFDSISLESRIYFWCISEFSIKIYTFVNRYYISILPNNAFQERQKFEKVNRTGYALINLQTVT